MPRPIHHWLILLAWLTVMVGCESKRTLVTEQQVQLFQRSIAILENLADHDKEGKKLNEAIANLQQLAKAYPKDVAISQNLCVAHLVRLRSLEATDALDEFDSVSQSLQSAIESLKKLDPDAVEPDLFESRRLQLRNEYEASLAAIRRACQQKNASPAILYLLHEQLQLENKPEDAAEAVRALQKASQLAPHNLAIAVSLLEQLAITSGGDFSKECDRVQELVRPIVARVDSKVPGLIQKAREAAEQSNWRTAQTQVAFLRNVLLAEVSYQNDLHWLEPHDLEYVRFDWEAQRKGSIAPAPKANNWRFLPPIPMPITDMAANAMASEDFDLDGHPDLFLADGKSIQVWSMEKNRAAERLTSWIGRSPYRGW